VFSIVNSQRLNFTSIQVLERVIHQFHLSIITSSQARNKGIFINAFIGLGIATCRSVYVERCFAAAIDRQWRKKKLISLCKGNDDDAAKSYKDK